MLAFLEWFQQACQAALPLLVITEQAGLRLFNPEQFADYLASRSIERMVR